MGTVYQDAYSITDTINAQVPSATQYNYDQTQSVLTKDNYTTAAAITLGAILDDGLSQKNLYEFCLQFQVKWNLAMAAMDADGGINTATFVTNGALGSVDGTYNIHAMGINQADLVTFLTAVATKFAAVTALLDADSTITDTNYASTLDFTLDTTKISGTGISQGAIVEYLQTIVTANNALWVKLDADL